MRDLSPSLIKSLHCSFREKVVREYHNPRSITEYAAQEGPYYQEAVRPVAHYSKRLVPLHRNSNSPTLRHHQGGSWKSSIQITKWREPWTTSSLVCPHHKAQSHKIFILENHNQKQSTSHEAPQPYAQKVPIKTTTNTSHSNYSQTLSTTASKTETNANRKRWLLHTTTTPLTIRGPCQKHRVTLVTLSKFLQQHPSSQEWKNPKQALVMRQHSVWKECMTCRNVKSILSKESHNFFTSTKTNRRPFATKLDFKQHWEWKLSIQNWREERNSFLGRHLVKATRNTQITRRHLLLQYILTRTKLPNILIFEVIVIIPTISQLRLYMTSQSVTSKHRRLYGRKSASHHFDFDDGANRCHFAGRYIPDH